MKFIENVLLNLLRKIAQNCNTISIWDYYIPNKKRNFFTK